jgi:hypothetical protein
MLQSGFHFRPLKFIKAVFLLKQAGEGPAWLGIILIVRGLAKISQTRTTVFIDLACSNCLSRCDNHSMFTCHCNSISTFCDRDKLINLFQLFHAKASTYFGETRDQISHLLSLTIQTGLLQLFSKWMRLLPLHANIPIL